MSPALQAKLQRLKTLLGELESIVVAFSGGVDSTLLLRVAADTPGLRYLAVTTESPTNAAREITEARRLAQDFGAPHRVVAVNELETPGYADNSADRCYLCKQTLYPLCFRIAEQEGLAFVVDGVNRDDLGDYRPGLVAAGEFGVRHPLVEAGLCKDEVRELSRSYGLPTAERPASPCLSSRFPYGTRISRDALARVEAAESFMRDLGFVELRVRHYATHARVEVAGAELARLHAAGMHERIRERLLDLGFAGVEIAEQPLRSGSLNDALDAGQRSAATAEKGKRQS